MYNDSNNNRLGCECISQRNSDSEIINSIIATTDETVLYMSTENELELYLTHNRLTDCCFSVRKNFQFCIVFNAKLNGQRSRLTLAHTMLACVSK